jgi:hypothetical protein
MFPGQRRFLIPAIVAVVAAGGAIATVSAASANEAKIEGQVTLEEIARASVPQWNFARANNNDPCWPEAAFDGSGKPASGSEPRNWPDTDGGCAPHGAPFPTYYTVQKCSPSDIRVTFTIYQANDAFQPSGHRHDFEGIAVVWRLSGNQWTRDTLVGSSHKSVHAWKWKDSESWNSDRGSAGYGREFPRVFVGFASHAMFNNQSGLKDVLSSFTDSEYRHADYPVWADQGGGLVEVAVGGSLYQKFKDSASAFGSATGNPAQRADNICNV